MRRITIDATNIRSHIHKQWDGNGSFKRYANTKKVKDYVQEKLQEKINSENVVRYDIRLNDYTIIVHFKDETDIQEIRRLTLKLIDDHQIIAYY